MIRIICILFIAIVFSGCTVEQHSITRVVIVNNTTNAIKVVPYRYGQEALDDQISIAPYTQIQVIEENSRGKTNVPIAFPRYSNNTDSIRVYFDNTLIITHYKDTTNITFSLKYYLPSSLRNLLNLNSYSNTITEESKSTRKWLMEYTFNPQDVVDAK